MTMIARIPTIKTHHPVVVMMANRMTSEQSVTSEKEVNLQTTYCSIVFNCFCIFLSHTYNRVVVAVWFCTVLAFTAVQLYGRTAVRPSDGWTIHIGWFSVKHPHDWYRLGGTVQDCKIPSMHGFRSCNGHTVWSVCNTDNISVRLRSPCRIVMLFMGITPAQSITIIAIC